jgi:DNA-binding transcriptional ArsR family regulator
MYHSFQPMHSRRPPRIIERASQVRVLASPVRQEIVDTLEALGGEAAVAAIAAHLGRPADGLYYHLHSLEAAGLVEEVPGGGDGRHYRIAARDGARLQLRYRPGRTANAAAVGRVAQGMLRTAHRDFAAALGDPAVPVAGPTRALWASRIKGWLDNAGVEKLNELFAQAQVLLGRGKPPPGAKLMSLTWVIAPVEARPARRGSGRSRR